jgi:hypothetical protein
MTKPTALCAIALLTLAGPVLCDSPPPCLIELVDGRQVPSTMAGELNGRIIARSPKGMAQSFAKAQVHAITENGRRRVLNARRALTAAERAARSEVVWGDAAEGLGHTPSYATQEWPAARLLVWAKPGQGGDAGAGGGWMEFPAAGPLRPAKKGPDKDTDILLPASDKGYTVSAQRDVLRHVTIERGASLRGRHWHGEVHLSGNTWLKPGGRCMYMRFIGPGHTVFRRDDRTGEDEPHNGAHAITHRLMILKHEGGSLEFFGVNSTEDEVMLYSGTMYLNDKFYYNTKTRTGVFAIFEGATLEMRSGAILATGKPATRMGLNFSVYKGGLLRAGSKDVPLTESACILLGWQGKPTDRQSGFYMAGGSRMEVHSADPAKARLIFSAVSDEPEHPGRRKADGPGKGDGIMLHLAGATKGLSGVGFNHVRTGGIHMTDLSAAKTWQNVWYGPDNAAKPERLFGAMVLKVDEYHPHKPGQNRGWVERQTSNAMKAYEPE